MVFVLIDGAAVLRSIPLGYDKGRRQTDINASALWVNHMSSILGLKTRDEVDEVEKELSTKWKDLSPERRMHIWKSWTKPGSENGELGAWDESHTVFETRWFGGMYYMYDDVDISINVETTNRTEMWLSANGLRVQIKESSWCSTSACSIM